MSGQPVTEVYTCAVCGKPSTRLLGSMAGLTLPDGAVTMRTVVRGYCRAHRDEVPSRMAAELAAVGKVEWMPDEPVELRPSEVQAYLATVQQMWVDSAAESGLMDLSAGQRVFDPAQGLPQQCPHCQGPMSWGTGPHVQDARARSGSMAWECLDCHAAGITM